MKYFIVFSFFPILLVSSLLFSLNSFAQTTVTDELEIKIDSIFKNFNDINKPGATVAVVKNQKIVFKKGYGSANLEYGIPNSHSTIIHIAPYGYQ